MYTIAIVLAVHAFLFVQIGGAFRDSRFISNTTDFCNCPSSCEEYSFSTEEYAKFDGILQQELATNNVLKSGWEKAKTLKKSHSKLSENEVLAVVTYTLEVPKVYEMFNFLTRTRGIKSDTYNYKGMHFFLSSAVHKLATTLPQSTFRCESAPNPAALTVGNYFSFKQFASSTNDYYQAMNFGEFCLHLVTLRGAPISSLSAFPDEKEILIPSCETFKVVPLEEGFRFYTKLESTGGTGNAGFILNPNVTFLVLLVVFALRC